MTDHSSPSSISFFLDIEPVAKGRPRLGKYGAYTPDKTRQAEKQIKVLSKPYCPISPSLNPIGLIVDFYLKRAKSNKRKYATCRPDLDNFYKLLTDSFNGLFWKDDSQIVDAIISKKYSDTSGINVTIHYFE